LALIPIAGSFVWETTVRRTQMACESDLIAGTMPVWRLPP
jgi:hypothetical protein